MKNLRSLRAFSAFIAVITSVAITIRADDLYIWAQETVTGVVLFYQGSINLDGFPVAGKSKGGKGGEIAPNEGRIRRGAGTSSTYDVLPGNGRQFGSGSSMSATGESGDEFALASEPDGILELPSGYVSHDPISGSIEFLGESLASLGITPTPFTFNTTAGSNTIHLFTNPADVAAAEAAAAAKSAAKATLLKQIQKLKKKVRKQKKKGKVAKAKKLSKKLKKLQAQLQELG